jgi:hypothetical protein
VRPTCVKAGTRLGIASSAALAVAATSAQEGAAAADRRYIEPRAYAYHSWQGWKLHASDGLVVFDW